MTSESVLRVNFGFLCNKYEDRNGKPTAEGVGLDGFDATGTPVRHPGFDAVLSMRFGPAEIGSKTVSLRLTDAAGTLIAPSVQQSIYIELSPDYSYRNQTVKITITDAEFPHFGDYMVHWLLDGTEVHNTPLKLLHSTAN